jgi:hypothetical protein
VKLIYALASLPFLGILGGIFFANRVEPFVLGMPFIFLDRAVGSAYFGDNGRRLPPRPCNKEDEAG